MIVPMSKIFCAARQRDQEALLSALGTAGVLHIEAYEPERAVSDLGLQRDLQAAEKALAMSRSQPASSPAQAAQISDQELVQALLAADARRQDVLAAQRSIENELKDLGPWGKVSREDLALLQAAGAELRIYRLPSEQVDRVEVACMQLLSTERGQALCAMVLRPGQAVSGEEVEEIPAPPRDHQELQRQLSELRSEEEGLALRIQSLAAEQDRLQAYCAELQRQDNWQRAQRSGLEATDLCAFQGWIPSQAAQSVEEALATQGLQAAISLRPPSDEEEPPTLIHYPRWSLPIKGLFDMMGTVAGYRENDVAGLFIIALPLFAAILISDAGYGLLLLALVLGLRKKMIAGMGSPFTNLALIISLATIAWGLVTNGFFGFPIYGQGRALVPVDISESSRALMMRVSFWIAGVHLSVAWLWQALRLWPGQRALAPLGWALAVWGMLGVVFHLLLHDPLSWSTAWPYLLIVGVTLGVLFHAPHPNPLRRLGAGLGNMPLEVLGKFSDEISYVRLMAVGLASSVLAQNFNEMAFATGYAMPLVLVLGHLLNFALCMIALFAHGVRLNMLEFSNNLGMQWSGHAYAPFRHRSSAS